MNKDLLEVELLDRVQSSIEENICSYEIEEIEDIFNENKGNLTLTNSFTTTIDFDYVLNDYLQNTRYGAGIDSSEIDIQ